MVEAAALDGIVQVARAVAGEHGHGRHACRHRAQLGNADLVLAQVFEQEGLEGLVGTVDLVDQQHGAGFRLLQGLQQRAAYQVALLVDLLLGALQAVLIRCGRGLRRGQLGRAQVQQLGRVVPFIQRLALLHAVIALQPDQAARQHACQRLGQRGLAHAGLALQQQRPLQPQGQEDGRGQAPVGEIAFGLQRGGQGVYGGNGLLGRHPPCHPSICDTARCVCTLINCAR